MSASKARVKSGGRRDPRPRHVDGTAPWALLKNRVDGEHYVYVNQGDPGALAHYTHAGYTPVELSADGPQPVGGCTSKLGENVEMMGSVLMRCSAERYAEIVEDGPWGGSGQRAADDLQKRIKTDGGADVRGIRAPGVSLEQDTTGI